MSCFSQIVALSRFLYLENVSSILDSTPTMRKLMWFIIQDFRIMLSCLGVSPDYLKPLLFLVSVRNVQPVDCCSCGARYHWPIAAFRLLACLNGTRGEESKTNGFLFVFLLYICLPEAQRGRVFFLAMKPGEPLWKAALLSFVFIR